MRLLSPSSSGLSSLPSSPKRPRTEIYHDLDIERDTSDVIALHDSRPAQFSAKEQRKAAAAAKRLEQQRIRKEKEAAKQKEKADRIRKAFANAEERGTFRRNEVEVVVSPKILADTTKRNDVLSHVRVFFPDQICSEDFEFDNLITWRRKRINAANPQSSGKEKYLDAHINVLVFSGAKYLDMMVSGNYHTSLLGQANEILLQRRVDQLFYVIYGIESECTKRMKNAVKPGANEQIITMKAVQDSYTVLYMDYGIRTHAFSKIEDAARYIVELTDAFADKPYYQQDDFLDATLTYRDTRKKLANRSRIVSMQEFVGFEENSMDGIEITTDEPNPLMPGDWDDSRDGVVSIPIMRSEDYQDLGFMYLAFLALIPRMTYEKGMAIRRRFPTMYHLEEAYRSCSSVEERNSMLAEVQYEPNNRRLGPALSKMIATVFTCADPNAAFRM